MYPMSLAMISAVLFLLGGALAVGALLRRKAGKRAVLAAVFAALCLCAAVGSAVGAAVLKHKFGSRAVKDEKTGIVYTAYTDKDGVETLYTANHVLFRKSEPDGSVTEYDENGTVTYTQKSDGSQQWFENGILTVEEDTQGTERHFNTDGKIVYENLSNGTEIWYKYDNDRVTKTFNSGIVSTYDHGKKVYYKDAQNVEYWYDAFTEKLIHSKDNNTHIDTWYEYDSDGNIKHVYSSDGAKLIYQNSKKTYEKTADGDETWYNLYGNVTAIKKANGEEKQYNDYRKLLYEKDSNGNKFTYNDNGDLFLAEYSDGTRIQYDLLYIRCLYPDGTEAWYEKLDNKDSYDSDHPIYTKKGNESGTWLYYNFYHLKKPRQSESDKIPATSKSETVHYEYDNNNRILLEIYDAGSDFEKKYMYFYDADNTLVDSVLISKKNYDGDFNIEWDKNERWFQINGFKYTYDVDGKLLHAFSPNELIPDGQYEYDINGNITYITFPYYESVSVHFENGKPVKADIYNGDTGYYMYNADGTVSCYTIISETSPDDRTSHHYVYDDAGNAVLEYGTSTLLRDENHPDYFPLWAFYYEYDSFGNPIHMWSSDFSYEEFYEYEYASAPAGRILSKTTKTKID